MDYMHINFIFLQTYADNRENSCSYSWFVCIIYCILVICIYLYKLIVYVLFSSEFNILL